jgi:hypothetical protein
MIGRSTATANLSHYNESGHRERWPVLVYRLQSHRGWEVYCDPDMEQAASSSAPNTSKKCSGAKQHQPQQQRPPAATVEELTAAPRVGCIEVRKMRLRIRLFEQHTPWNNNANNHQQQQAQCGVKRGDSQGGTRALTHGQEEAAALEVATASTENNSNEEEDSDIPGRDNWNNNALLVRRLNTLLISTRRGMGAIVLQFKNNQECIEFCDRLVYLNREYFGKSLPGEEGVGNEHMGIGTKRGMDDGFVNGMDQRDYYCNEIREFKKRQYAVMGDQDTMIGRSSFAGVHGGGGRAHEHDMNNGEEEGVPTAQEAKQQRRKDEILSYIVRLAHDEEFRGFVDEVERGLEMAPDTAGVHAALGC